jgi:hypothetical protein
MTKSQDLEMLKKLAKDTFDEIQRQIQLCKTSSIYSDEDIESIELYGDVFGNDMKDDLRKTIEVLTKNLLYYINQYETYYNVSLELPYDLLNFNYEIESICVIEKRNAKTSDVEAVD